MKIRLIIILMILTIQFKHRRAPRVFYEEKLQLERAKKELQFWSAMITSSPEPKNLWYKKYDDLAQKIKYLRNQREKYGKT